MLIKKQKPNEYYSSSLLLHLLLFSSYILELCSASDNITSTQFLRQPETIVSSNNIFKLGFFNPTNSTSSFLGIWYNQVSVMDVIWVANRNSPVTNSSGILRISDDGNLQVLNGKMEILWSSNVSVTKTNISAAKLVDSGNLVLLGSDFKTIIWQSFDQRTDTFLPNMMVVLTQSSNQEKFLKSWTSPSDPSEGRFSAGIDSFVIPQLIIWNGDQPYWRSGPWNGNLFIGVQNNGNDANVNAGLILATDREGTISLTYTYSNASFLSNYALTNQGTMVQKWWNDGKRNWEVVWQAPETDCDVYGKCGEFGICNARESPICQCLKGFEPKNKEEWSNGNWTNGCIRRTELQCGSGGGKPDGFFQLKMVKVPDQADWWRGLNEDECRSQCSNNCSCLAYTYDTGAGCMSWSGQLIDTLELPAGTGFVLNLRLAHSELGNHSKAKVAIAVIIGCLGAAGIATFIFFRRRRNAWQRERKIERNGAQLNMHGQTNSQDKLEELPLFKFETLVNATNNFHRSNKLGQGGFGPVYKGTLEDGQEIAVKRLSKASGQGLEEFMNEVLVISKLQHRNLVRLLGCCVEGEEKMLIYEYMPNKSLDALLFDPQKRESLNWRIRFNIIQGICRGLLYLHRDSRLRIIHRDLKASNILLDENLNPKISDFGMARIFGGNQDEEKTRRVVGTYGYMSPEYAMEGQFSEKSDVFSFGVLLLEIISGIRNSSFWIEEQSLSLLGYAWKLWSEDKMYSLVDPTISESYYRMEILKCIHIGLLCVQEFAKDRPSISKVISMLSSEIADLPSPKEPGFSRRQISKDEGSSQQQSSSANDLTITNLSAR